MQNVAANFQYKLLQIIRAKLVANEGQLFIGISYRSGTINSNTANSKYHLIRSFFEIFARFLSFHV